MLKILQVSTFYSFNGGVEKSVSDLVAGLKEFHDVRVLCTKKGGGTSRENVDGVEVTSVGSLMTMAGRPVSTTLPFEMGRQSCDVVHYHLPFPLAMASHLLSAPRAKLAVATWHHDIVNNPRFKTLSQPIMELFLDRMDVIVATAPALVEHTKELYKRRQKCRVVPLGIDDQPFNQPVAASQVESLKQSLGTPLILFVGRLVYYKGVNVLIQAMTQLNASLVIVGQGPLQAEFETLVKELGLSERVRFLGRVNDQELVTLYQACDIFVLPSTLPTECFGLVQVEAMLAGKPVVNTSLPTGVPWVSIDGETGITVPPGDSLALATVLSDLLKDDELRLRLGKNARRRAQEQFTLQKHVNQIAELYSEFVS